MMFGENVYREEILTDEDEADDKVYKDRLKRFETKWRRGMSSL